MGGEYGDYEMEISVKGMACESCVRTVAQAAKSVSGVIDAAVDLKSGSVKVKGRGGSVDRRQVVDAIRAAGYEAF
jgi:copper chaperone CopZ